MTCNTTNFIEYYSGDNNPIVVTVTNDDGTPIDGLDEDLSNAIFKALGSDGSVVLDLKYDSDPAKISYDKVDGNDIFTISPTTDDMTIDPGDYDIYFKLVILNPNRNHHVNMFSDGIRLTRLRILPDGI